MKRRKLSDRLISCLLSCVLLLQLLPLQVFAATDEMLRFQVDQFDPSLQHIILASHEGRVYAMGGALDNGKGRRAVEVNDDFSFIMDYGDGYVDEYRCVEILRSKGTSLFGVAVDYNNFVYAFTEAGGTQGLFVDESGTMTNRPSSEGLQYWESGWFSDDQWVSGINRTDTGSGNRTYIVLRVDDGEPYFTAVSDLDEGCCPTSFAKEICAHPMLTYHEGYPADCVEPGDSEYWSCGFCDLYFSDQKGRMAIVNKEQTIIQPLGHCDENLDAMCDRCGCPMPTFVPVTANSQIKEGRTYLLATEIDGKIYLACAPDGKSMYSFLLPMTDAVTVENDGKLTYHAVESVGAMKLQLTSAAEDENLDDGEYRYTIVVTGAGGALECMWGDFMISGDRNSKYGWRVSLIEEEATPVRIEPVEFMPEEIDVMCAYADASVRGFSLLTEEIFSVRTGVSASAHPVFLYVMTEEDAPLDTWNYELTEADSIVDTNGCEELPEFDFDLAQKSSVSGLMGCVTVKTIEEMVAVYRSDMDAAADDYTIEARSDLCYTPSGDELAVAVTHKLVITGEGQESRAYPLDEAQLSSGSFSLSLYTPFVPEQILRDDGATYREVSHKLVSEPYNIALPFEVDEAWVNFQCDILPDGFLMRETAVMEDHTHPWNYEDFFYNDSGEWYACSACDEPWKIRDHAFDRFEADTYDQNGVTYTVDPTVESPGTAEIYCTYCGYSKEQAIDPQDNWVWLVLQDENGNPLPEGIIQYVNWKYKGVIYAERYEDVGVDCLAWHFDERKSQSWADANLSCEISFTDNGRELFVVPWTLTYENLQMGEPLCLKLKSREEAAITIVGRLAEDLREYSSFDISIRAHTQLEGGGIVKDAVLGEDGTFRVTMPYGSTQVEVDIRQRGTATFRDVQIMQPNEQGEIDLGLVEIPNCNGQEIFDTVVYLDSNAESAEAARWLAANGQFVLINEETGAVCEASAYLPNDQPADGVYFRIMASHGFVVGDTLRLECLTDSSRYKADNFTFVLQERGQEETVLDLNFYQYGTVMTDFTYESSYWCLLFDGEGNLVNNNFFGSVYLPQGEYVCLAYEKNPYIGRVDRPAMEELNIPAYLYLQKSFTVDWGEEVCLTGTVPSFSPSSAFSLQATVDASHKAGDLVPIYITYRDFADLGNDGLTFRIFSGESASTTAELPLVQNNGRYATWDGDSDALTEEVKIGSGSWRKQELYLTTHRSEGTICLYAKQEGGTLYITTPWASTAVELPQNSVTVKTPAATTSSYQGTFVYYANLPEKNGPYEAVLYVDGVPTGFHDININGRGANEIPYQFNYQYDASIHELRLEIFSRKDGQESGESVWQSEIYPVMYNTTILSADPYKLTVRIGSNRYDLDLNSATNPRMSIAFFPSDFNKDNTINRDLVFNYQLHMHGSDRIANGQVLMRVYCGETLAEPTIHHVTMNYNKNTNTFDGSLTLKADTFTVNELPYGYSFAYDDYNSETSDVSMEQVADKLLAQAAEWDAREVFEIPEKVDMDALEVVLADPDFDELSRQLLRIQASAQNELHDIYTEFSRSVNAIHIEGLDLPLSEAMDLTALLQLNPEYHGEYLKAGITEAQLVENYGYYSVEAADERYYLLHTEQCNSVIIWNQGLHLWEGFFSPLPEGEPLTAEEASVLVLRAASPVLMSGRSDVRDPVAEMISNAFSEVSTPLYVANTFMAALLDPLLVLMDSLYTMLESKRQLLYAAVRAETGGSITELILKAKLESANEMLRTKTADIMSGIPNRMDADIYFRQNLTEELKEIAARIRSLKKQLLEFSEQMRLMEVERVKDGRSALTKLKDSVTDVLGFSGKIKIAMESKGAKVLGGAMAIAGIVGGYVSMLQSLQLYLRELDNAAIELEYGLSLIDRCIDDAGDPCTSNQIEAMEQAEECIEAFENFETQVNDVVFWYGAAYNAKAYLWLPNAISSAATIFTANPIVMTVDLSLGALTNVSEATAMAAVLFNTGSMKRAQTKMLKECVGPLPFKKTEACEDGNGNKKPRNEPTPVPKPDFEHPPTPLIDPAGYVYEAVSSNRVEGATATVWYEGPNGQPVRWDEASVYGEINPQRTDTEGLYSWMTPIGNWLVTVSKEGYYDGDSRNDPAAVNGWLPVPPPQLDVNIALVSKAAPAVESAAVTADRVRIVFSQYMDIAQIVSGGLAGVTQDGAAIPVTMTFPDREESPTEPGTYYGRILELTRTDGGTFAGSGFTVTVSAAAQNYAGTAMGGGYVSGLLAVTRIPDSVEHSYPNRYVTDVDKSEEIVVLVRDTQGLPVENVLVTASPAPNGTLTVTPEVVTDSEGRAVFTVLGITPGDDTVTFAVGTVRTQMNTRVAPFGSEAPAKPSANLSDYQTVASDTQLILSCETEGAVIYYTTDNTCPCEESGNRQIYTGSISVTETTLFRIASWTEAGGYSERLNLHVVVKPEEAEPVSAVWNENRCTVTLERVDSGVQIIAASYDPYEKMLQVEYLTAEKATVTLIGDSVKVFFIDQGSYAPVRKALELQP